MSHIGLEFKKIDLHVHTTASACYKERRSESTTPEMIVHYCLEKGFDAIAITDHNTGKNIDEMKAVSKNIKVDSKMLMIFPGVEISTHEGFHLVAIFNTEYSTADIGNFLGAINISGENFGKSEIQSSKSVYEIITEIKNRKGLAIFAHIDSYKGAFFELTVRNEKSVRVPKNCCDLLNSKLYDAVEVIDSKLPLGFDKEHGVNRIPAFYQASDDPLEGDEKHHNYTGIGKRYAWFALDKIDIEGLRQCFVDPEVRIRLQEKGIPIANWPRINSVKIGENGFLRNQSITLHPGLNCIIGGKGAGKSLIIEFIRHALDQPPMIEDILEDHNSKLENRLIAFTPLEIEFQTKDGSLFTLVSKYKGETKCINKLTGEEYKGEIRSLFPVLAYSQNEIIRIAENKNAQLNLIDSSINVDKQKLEILRLIDLLNENSHKVLASLLASERIVELETLINSKSTEIEILDNRLASSDLKNMKDAEEKNNFINGQEKFVESLLHIVEKANDSFCQQKSPEPKEILNTDTLIISINTKIASLLKNGIETINNLFNYSNQISDEIKNDRKEWDLAFQQIKTAYEKKLSGTDLPTLEIQRRQANDALMELQSEFTDKKALSDDLQKLLGERNDLLNRIDIERKNYSNLRLKRFTELSSLSNGRIRMNLRINEDKTNFIERIKNLLKGGPEQIPINYREDLAREFSPKELGEIVINKRINEIVSKAHITELIANRIMTKFWSQDILQDVLLAQFDTPVEDIPIIEYDKGNKNFAPLSEISTGQKCTALLIIALCDGEIPIIVDQPEDALDIATVWEDVSRKIRIGKSTRQFVLTTHNSSLAVGSDSDNFLVVKPIDGDHAEIAECGALDREEVRVDIIKHLEGGSEPYLLKNKKYNISDN